MKTTKNLNQDRQSPGPRMEPVTSRILRMSVSNSTTTFGAEIKIARDLNHDSRSSGLDMNPGRPEYESGVLNIC
jgi:hypothetical protein